MPRALAPLLTVLLLFCALGAQPDSQSTGPLPGKPEVARLSRLHEEVRQLTWRMQAETNTAQRTKLIIRLKSKRQELRRAQRKAVFATSPYPAMVEEAIAQLVRRSYPSLKGLRIDLHDVHWEDAYFSSFFAFPLPFKKRTYKIGINLRAFDRDLPEEAMKSILSHELGHTLAYSKRNFFQMFGLVKIFLNPGSLRRFERRADLEAIRRGHARGLIEYRNWVYRNIPAAKIEEKRRTYYAPEEIEALERERLRNPQLFELWLRDPPMTLEQIRRSAGEFQAGRRRSP